MFPLSASLDLVGAMEINLADAYSAGEMQHGVRRVSHATKQLRFCARRVQMLPILFCRSYGIFGLGGIHLVVRRDGQKEEDSACRLSLCDRQKIGCAMLQ